MKFDVTLLSLISTTFPLMLRSPKHSVSTASGWPRPMATRFWQPDAGRRAFQQADAGHGHRRRLPAQPGRAGLYRVGLAAILARPVHSRPGAAGEGPQRAALRRQVGKTGQEDARDYRGHSGLLGLLAERYAARLLGEFFKLAADDPLLRSRPHRVPTAPIYIAAVNEQMLRLAGSHCDGVHIHALHTVRYLREVALPDIETGLAKRG